jgi:hypothetical protein
VQKAEHVDGFDGLDPPWKESPPRTELGDCGNFMRAGGNSSGIDTRFWRGMWHAFCPLFESQNLGYQERWTYLVSAEEFQWPYSGSPPEDMRRPDMKQMVPVCG